MRNLYINFISCTTLRKLDNTAARAIREIARDDDSYFADRNVVDMRRCMDDALADVVRDVIN